MKLFLDYETYYDDQFSLKKLTPPEYILDKRFEVHGCAVKEGVDGKGFWLEHEELGTYFKSLDASTTITFTFNALFDMCITEWIYGFDPWMMTDVLGMSRALRGHLFATHSLASVARALGLPPKGDAIAKVKGMRTAEIKANPMLYAEFTDYALRDNELCACIYTELAPEFPRSETRVMDMVLRCAVQPQFRLNRRRLVLHRRKLRQHKAKLLRDCGVDRVDLMSAARFQTILEQRGVVVEMKVSPTGRTIPALAKTDEFMANLVEHADPDIAALAAARLGHKSTLEETRAKRFTSLSKLPAAFFYPAGSAPIALRYGAAHTGRLGGEWKLNFQNLTRGGELRYAIEAAVDETLERDDVIVAPDFSQIEARMVALLAGQENLLEMFDMPKSDPRYDPYKHDPYNVLAGVIFNRPVNRKIKADEIEGFIGKTGILGLGYGAGKDKFHRMVHLLARTQLGHDISFSQFEADNAVDVYRKLLFPAIPKCWYALDALIPELCWEKPRNDVWKLVFPMLEFEHEAIVLPNEMRLRYHDLKQDEVTGEWTYKFGRETRNIYGAKVLENISQALARIIAMNAALRIYDRTGLRMGLQAHDELVYAVPRKGLTAAKDTINIEMTRRPSWAKKLPLAIEIKDGATYGDAK